MSTNIPSNPQPAKAGLPEPSRSDADAGDTQTIATLRDGDPVQAVFACVRRRPLPHA